MLSSGLRGTVLKTSVFLGVTRSYSGLFTHIKHGDVAKVSSFLSKISNKGGRNALKLAVNSRDAAGLTPLMVTASIPSVDSKAAHNKQAIIQALLKTPGVDVNAQDGWGRTALHICSQNNDREVVKMLLDAGADKEILDSDYFSAADYTTDQTIDEQLHLQHSCNPPDPPQHTVRLTPSKIRSQSPAKRSTSPEFPAWWWDRNKAAHKYDEKDTSDQPASPQAMQEYVDSVTAAAHEAFEKAEAAITDAARAASSPAVRASLAGVEYQQAFDSIFRTFQEAEAAIDTAALKAASFSAANTIHRAVLPGLEYEEELAAAIAETPVEAAKADEALEQLGEELGNGALQSLDTIEVSDEVAAIDLLSIRDDEELVAPEDSMSEMAEMPEDLFGTMNPLPPQHTHMTHLPGPCILHPKDGTTLAQAEKWAWALEAAGRLSHPPSTLPQAKFRHRTSTQINGESLVLARAQAHELPTESTRVNVNLNPAHEHSYDPEMDATLHPSPPAHNGHQVYNPDNIPYNPKTWEQMEADRLLRKKAFGWQEESGWYDGDKYSGRYSKTSTTSSNNARAAAASKTGSNEVDWYVGYEVDVHEMFPKDKGPQPPSASASNLLDTADTEEDIATRRAVRAEMVEQGSGVQEGCDIGDDEIEHRMA